MSFTVTNKSQPKRKSTLTHDGVSYIVTRPDGHKITCHNRGTALWYVRNPHLR